jgi:DeoR family transcriptional regulator, suf operon transcriptional repressor
MRCDEFSPAAGTVAALDALPATRRSILLHLRASGEAGAEDLARLLGITPGAVRQQLRPLVDDGWLEHRDLRPGPGRPRRRYRLSARAAALFPQSYGELAVEVLGHVADEDAALVERAFARRRDARVTAAHDRLAVRGPDLGERVAELARILDEQGYMATAAPARDGTLLLTENNCAILAVARRHPCACSSELEFLREALPDADVERVRHIARGDAACAYVARPRRAPVTR